MRMPLLTVLVLALAGPASAQTALGLDRSVELQAQQDMTRQRLDAQRNEIEALDSRVRTEQRLSDLQTQREYSRLRPVTRTGSASGAAKAAPASPYVSIHDSVLADSDAKVRAASGQSR